ncbi:MAG: rhomboid family intramembrane serine protease [Leptolyngbya sp. SIO4C1]|nr:rhomboid family intramembrane serine protease [Leptolyngbya sp. SIO4C1]
MKSPPVLIYVILGVILLPLSVSQDWQTQAEILRDCVLLVWAVSVVNLLYLNGALNHVLGIKPRQLFGLVGIVFAPLLHTGFSHLISNTVPFMLLSWLVMLRSADLFFAISVWIMTVGGLGTWLIGRDRNHIGASSVVFGYLGYLIAVGYIETTLIAILTTLAVLFLYGNRLGTMLPSSQTSAISWEGHLFGFLSGAFAAYQPNLLGQVNLWLSQL